MEKVLVGAIVGAAVGAALGALSGITAPKETPRQSLEKAFTPNAPSGSGSGLPPSSAPAGPPAAPITNLGDAAAKVSTDLATKAAGALVPHAATASAGFTGALVVQTIAVDLTAAGSTAFWDDLQGYVRTHNVNLGPFNFIKGD